MADPEIIEVEVERLEPEPTRAAALVARGRSAVAPLLIAGAIDLADFLAFGPLHRLELPLGLLGGYAISGRLSASPTWRVLLALGTGAYCVLPLDWMPVSLTVTAILLAAGPRLLQREPFRRRQG